MSDRRDIIYLYDGSFEGLLTAVFECFLLHKFPSAFEITENSQQSLECDCIHVNSDSAKAERVLKRVLKASGSSAVSNIYKCFLSSLPDKDIYIFNYIRACIKFGFTVNSRLTIKCVERVISAAKAVGGEAHLYTGFIRFSELDGGIYYSCIEPKNNILPLIVTHFRNRYPGMPFIIHDTARNQCLVYDGKSCTIHHEVGMPMLNFSHTENKYRKMWKEFYDTIEIKERRNEQCRMSHMPKRYWKFMTEFM